MSRCRPCGGRGLSSVYGSLVPILSQGDSLSHAWLTSIAVFQITGAVATALSVMGALFVVFIRDPSLERQREAERNAAKQIERDRDDERLERDRRAQAQRISAWYAGPAPKDHDDYTGRRVELVNRSDEPVYNVVVIAVFIQGAAPRDSEGIARMLYDTLRSSGYRGPGFMQIVLNDLPPGQHWVRMIVDTGFHNARMSVEISFTDVRGVHWVRRANGKLDELPSNPIDYFEVERPIDYRTPER